MNSVYLFMRLKVLMEHQNILQNKHYKSYIIYQNILQTQHYKSDHYSVKVCRNENLESWKGTEERKTKATDNCLLVIWNIPDLVALTKTGLGANQNFLLISSNCSSWWAKWHEYKKLSSFIACKPAWYLTSIGTYTFVFSLLLCTVATTTSADSTLN